MTLCDEFVGNTDNQYLQYVFDVSEIIRKCHRQPVLKLNFGSAIKIALELSQTGPCRFSATKGVLEYTMANCTLTNSMDELR